MSDKIVLLTGVSSGIGLALFHYFLEAKEVKKIIAISRNVDKLRSEIKDSKEKTQFISIDLSQANFSNLLENTLKNYPTIDILINNAGTLLYKSFENISPKNWQDIFQTNVFSPAELIQTALPWLKKSELAHVINITSMGGFQGSAKFPGLSAYSASKAALANLTECLAAEYKKTNIRFNALALGAVQTPMLEKAFPNYHATISAQEMANFIGNFALHCANMCNGKVLPISATTP